MGCSLVIIHDFQRDWRSLLMVQHLTTSHRWQKKNCVRLQWITWWNHLICWWIYLTFTASWIIVTLLKTGPEASSYTSWKPLIFKIRNCFWRCSKFSLIFRSFNRGSPTENQNLFISRVYSFLVIRNRNTWRTLTRHRKGPPNPETHDLSAVWQEC